MRASLGIVFSGCAALGGIASVGLLVAGNRDLAYLGGGTTLLLAV